MAKPTLLDRSIQILIPDPDNTPSRQKGVSVKEERLHHMHGVFLIREANEILLGTQKTFATAATIFHRFFHQVSLTDVEVWSIAMACTVLAAKIEDVALPFRQVIVAFVHLYRKRTLCIGSSSSTNSELL